ncbi:MAG: 16S rRNA (adenine(1518)-N(6)/adenine(1519)-N(6))-dimethyltransferase RsmA [Muribaculaceae bacterium]|nr:16S rRNA (adenine(1518)-N(6)/adenine(1519)-N(6))-dimethyltransferase RsmA [Muribaculaceae bacterium]
MTAVRPKKALGQHFLTDLSVARRIAATLDDFRDTPVIEVGPGMGVLTRFLLDEGHDVVVAELDTESVDYLRATFPTLDGRIIEGDFLKMNLNEVMPGDGKFCVIGNYPYNISSQIFFHVLEYRERIACCSGMLQKEVAERLAAAPGTKARGILSVLLQAWFDISYLFSVPPGVFNPPPKVQSGVIKMVPNGRTDLGADERLFKTIVKTTFGQRRKTIRNSIKGLLPPGAPLPDSPLLAMRPEQLSVDEFITLTNLVSQSRH